MHEVNLAITGNICSEPVLRQTKTGEAFLSFRVAVNERRWKAADNQWVDGDAQYFSVIAFRSLAGNAYHSLVKGQPVMVSGRLRIATYEAKDGSQRTSAQIEAHDLGTSLKFGQTSYTPCKNPKLPSNDRLAQEGVAEVLREVEDDAASCSAPKQSASSPSSTAAELIPA